MVLKHTLRDLSRLNNQQLLFVLIIFCILHDTGTNAFGLTRARARACARARTCNSPLSLHQSQRPTTTRRHVLRDPSSQETTRPRPKPKPDKPKRRISNTYGRKSNNGSRRNNKSNQDDLWANGRWKKAEQVEANMLTALEAMKDTIQGKETLSVTFPSVRDCNAAMATFGDGNKILRALGLFLKMRKATTMAQTSNLFLWSVPAPTLVTYSTLMSRAVRAGKERLALRLWYLMKTQAEFFSSMHHLQANKKSSPSQSEIIPDVKAANILMNVHAKLCDVESAQYLLSQMVWGNGTDVPRLEPNLVTYNSLLDACHKAGDLDAALEAKQQLDDSGLAPDARTYTTLIATVGRKASCASGAKDPSMAFGFLNEMVSLHIRPNGMTYSALIDACARCGRTDMALKGLRTMLRQKAKDRRALRASGTRRKYALYNEVGAWTAAINALGKAGSIDSAMRLFYTMPKTGVQPNTITCGCLTDCLLRYGRTSETLSVLRYMKQEGIAPSEVMYTSLITSAGRLVELENRQRWNAGNIMEDDLLVASGDTKAIEVYTVLMKTLSEEASATDKDNTQLMKVFLIFQQMKAAGAEPDLACYNALLRVCSQAGDVTRVMDVLRKIEKDGLVPNDTSWRAALKTAATARRPDLAEDIWQKGLEVRGERQMRVTWKPSVDSFANLLSAYIREASDCSDDPENQAILYKKVITMYKDIMTGSSKRRIEKEELMKSTRALGMILRAFVSLDFIQGNDKHKLALRRVAVSIAELDLWKEQDRIENITWKSLQIAERWKKEFDTKNVKS